jgi:hypothetical protein
MFITTPLAVKAFLVPNHTPSRYGMQRVLKLYIHNTIAALVEIRAKDGGRRAIITALEKVHPRGMRMME